MGKAEEYRAKKRNKAARKRLSSTVDFTQGVQAAKHRRKVGRRRICEGMCFSLPTPDDPFNELYKEKLAKKKAKKDQENEAYIASLGRKEASKVDSTKRELRGRSHKLNGSAPSAKLNKMKKPGSVAATQQSEKNGSDDSLNKAATDGFLNHAGRNGLNDVSHEEPSRERFKWKPSCERCMKKEGSWTCVGEDAFERALCALLNAGIITDDYQHEKSSVGELIRKSEKVHMGSKWDWLFWEACGTGLDVLATGRGALANGALVAVAHIMARKDHQILCSSPAVLFIVQSKEQTLQVRSIFKVLKPLLGLHSVSLHTGVSLQHQIEGLSSTPAKILIATPDRLCNLLSVNAISLSNVSFMVIDGLEGLISCGFSDQLVHIREKVSDNAQLVLLSGNDTPSMYAICQKLLTEPIRRVISDTSISQCSAWISQNVQVFVREDRRQQQLSKIIRNHFESRGASLPLQGLLVLFRQSQSLAMVKASIQEEGYSADCFVGDSVTKDKEANPVLEQFRNGQVEVLLSCEEYIGQIDVADVGVVICCEFPSTMDSYCRILTSMARYTVKGMLYSFCSAAMAPMALQLVEILEQCLQPVPTSLKMLAKAATLVEQSKP